MMLAAWHKVRRMGSHPSSPPHRASLWHAGFAECVRERAPAGFELLSEFQLSLYPRRADLLVLRRSEQRHGHDQGRIMRALWPRLAQATIIEFKSPSRGFRHSDLIRLYSYGSQYHADGMDIQSWAQDLSLVLATPRRTRALESDLDRMGWHLQELDDGYARIVGPWYTTFVVFTNHVAEAEHDDFLRIFSDRAVQTQEALHWLERWIIMKDHDVTEYEDHDELLDKLLSSLPPQRRLAGIPPQERLAGIPPEQTVLALPDEVLRGLSDDYIRSLPEHVQSAIRKRLAGSPTS